MKKYAKKNFFFLLSFRDTAVCLHFWVNFKMAARGPERVTSYFEAVCYSSISKRPVFCGWYESFSSFRKSPEYLDLEQMKFKDSILYKFKATPPFPQYFNTALWLANNNLKNLLWFSASSQLSQSIAFQTKNCHETVFLIGCTS